MLRTLEIKILNTYCISTEYFPSDNDININAINMITRQKIFYISPHYVLFYNLIIIRQRIAKMPIIYYLNQVDIFY